MPSLNAEKMRVAMLAPGELFGGAERQILLLLSYLVGRRVECYLLCFHDGELAVRARALGVPTEVLAVSRPLSLANARHIAAFIEERQIRVLHVHGYKAAAHALLARTHARFRMVRTEHGGVEAHASVLRNFKPRLYRIVENFATRRLAGHIVYVTRELALRCAHEHDGMRSSVIVNGIEPLAEEARRAPAELLQSGTWNAVVVGRLEPVKGVEFAIRAMAVAGVPANVRLWVIGDGPLRSELETQAASLVPDRVRFTGFRHDAVSFIANADVLLMPSLHEGLPYTLLEAISANVPVIASRVGGLAEILKDQHSALLISAADADALGAAIAKLAATPEAGRTLAATAFRELAPLYTAEKMGGEYLALYESLARA
jgi:glycosyltransferase involved in cell wall biosynthesis